MEEGVSGGMKFFPRNLVGVCPHQMKSVKTTLSRREEEISRLVATGMTDARIAKRLNIGYGTVKSHLTTIRKKLAIALGAPMINRVELALYVHGIDYVQLQSEAKE